MISGFFNVLGTALSILCVAFPCFLIHILFPLFPFPLQSKSPSMLGLVGLVNRDLILSFSATFLVKKKDTFVSPKLFSSIIYIRSPTPSG